MIQNAPCFSTLVNRIESMLRPGLGTHFQTSAYQERRERAKQLLPVVLTPVEPLIDVMLGLRTTIRPGYPEMRTLNFPKKVLGEGDSRELTFETQTTIRGLLLEVFASGILMQYLFFNFPSRDRTFHVDLTQALEEWAVNALVANQQMKAWNQEAEGIPGVFYGLYWRDELEPMLKDQFGVGLWKRGKASSLLENIFFAGAQWALSCDLATVDE